MTNRELHDKVEKIIYERFPMFMLQEETLGLIAVEEIMDLIKEVVESVIPKVNDPDRPFDNRVGTIQEIKDNISELFKDE